LVWCEKEEDPDPDMKLIISDPALDPLDQMISDPGGSRTLILDLEHRLALNLSSRDRLFKVRNEK